MNADAVIDRIQAARLVPVIRVPDSSSALGLVEQLAEAGVDVTEVTTTIPGWAEVSALYGFTRIDAPEWEVQDTPDSRRVALSSREPTWVPCAEMRGEGIFLRLREDELARWERDVGAVRRAIDVLGPAHRAWRAQPRFADEPWPGLRYVLLHTLAHVLIREFALESGYSAAEDRRTDLRTGR